MKKKIFLGIGALGTSIVMLPLFAAFEAHVINVTARIENALFVHPQSLEYGTVFPQEHLDSSFFIAFSESFSQTKQQRVGNVEYVIKQKPECADNQDPDVHPPVGEDQSGNFVCPTGSHMMPNLCPYLSKEPDNNPSTGPNANNDTGVPAFHDPNDPASWAHGKLVKFNPNHTTNGNDPADVWNVDLAVPCFKGDCAQDWAQFVHSLNPNANPDDFVLDPSLEHQKFGCDLWIEVTKIY